MEHADEFLHASRASGTPLFLFDPDRDLVFGHEFTAASPRWARTSRATRPATSSWCRPRCSIPTASRTASGTPATIPARSPSGWWCRPTGTCPSPTACRPTRRPRSTRSPPGSTACGAPRSNRRPVRWSPGADRVGLGALAALVERGIDPIVVSDPSASRRDVARSFGAHVVVDPTEDDPVAAWRDLADASQRLYVYEASGKPGVLDSLLYTVPSYTRISVVGACMVDDPIRPIVGIYKNVTIEFCFGMGPDGDEYPFAATFERLADGRIDASKLVTGYAGLEGVDEVFQHLRPGDYRDIDHMKILVRHDIDGPGIHAPSLPTSAADDSPPRRAYQRATRRPAVVVDRAPAARGRAAHSTRSRCGITVRTWRRPSSCRDEQPTFGIPVGPLHVVEGDVGTARRELGSRSRSPRWGAWTGTRHQHRAGARCRRGCPAAPCTSSSPSMRSSQYAARGARRGIGGLRPTPPGAPARRTRVDLHHLHPVAARHGAASPSSGSPSSHSSRSSTKCTTRSTCRTCSRPRAPTPMAVRIAM